MQNSFTLRRFSLTAFALALLIALVVGALFVVGAQNAVQASAQTQMTDAAAAQDLQMVLQELERERLDQPNAHPPSTHWESAPTFFESSVHGYEEHPSME
ncbi:MAG: hypothetical protein HZC40_15775 [Chloroflexi bacterium]|nr:hypothetical protein [Chloroflexota bacterium]